MTINDVTYLSVFPNTLSEKPNSDIDSIVKICNYNDQLNFNSKYIYTCQHPSIDHKDVNVFKINELKLDGFTEYVVLNYPEMFNSEFMINFHCDGFIINPESWDDDFLQYDYIGSPFDAGGLRKPCAGNGGFSLRSKKFCTLFRDMYLKIPSDYKKMPEDFLSCHVLRESLEEQGIRFAPFEVCSKFSTEHLSSDDKYFYSSFGIHEFEPISKEEVEKRSLNVDLKYIAKNPDQVKTHRWSIHKKIFNGNEY